MTKPALKLPNKIRCKMCGVELESRYLHDFHQCQCPNEAYVDGGQDYSRIGGKDLSMVEVWTTEGWRRVQSPPASSWYHKLWIAFDRWIRSFLGS